MNEHKNHWWDFYFVRYAMGTIIGAIIVYYIATKSPMLHWLPIAEAGAKSVKPSVLVYYGAVYGSIGLAYCYVSSAPILVFHAARFIGPSLKDKKCITVVAWTTIGIALLLTALGIGLPGLGKYVKSTLILFLPGWVFIVMLINAVMLIFPEKKRAAFEYYKRLTMARSKDDDWRSEMVESYRHLREHGNSFFILVLEAIFGLGLYVTAQFHTPLAILAYITVWAVPPVAVWLFALNLEWQFSNT